MSGHDARVVGPLWDGNEVWLVIAGGATFAAFPDLVRDDVLRLLCRVLHPRSPHRAGRLARVARQGRAARWKPSGLAEHNRVVRGAVPLGHRALEPAPRRADCLRPDVRRHLGDLFSLYSVVAGIALCLLFALHGAVFLALRTLGDLRARATRTASRIAPAAAVVGAGFLVWTLVVATDVNDKDLFPGVVPAAIAAVGAVAAVFLTRAGNEVWAFVATATTIAGAVVTLFGASTRACSSPIRTSGTASRGRMRRRLTTHWSS